MSDSGLEWVRGHSLHPDELRQAARWLHWMDEDYYSLFTDDTAQLEALLVACFRDPESEFGTTTFARSGGKLAGLVTAFASNEMFARRIFVLKALLAASPDAAEAKRKLRGFDGAARKVPPDAFYLAKLYLDAPMRGSGLSDALLAHFVEAGRARGCKLCLHVRNDNAAARALYRKHGFADSVDPSTESGAYRLMEKYV